MTQPIQEITSGFEQPRQPQDEWVLQKYQELGLGAVPSLQEIEPVATALLEDITTALTGGELVLGRRIDSDVDKEPEVLPILLTPGFTGSERFGLLLMQRETEKMRAARLTE